jgi:hypothetical protein
MYAMEIIILTNFNLYRYVGEKKGHECPYS